MKIRYWNHVTKQFSELEGSLPFTVFGETFAARRSLGNREQWTVAHVATGFRAGRNYRLRAEAVVAVREQLTNMGEKTVRKAVEKARAEMARLEREHGNV